MSRMLLLAVVAVSLLSCAPAAPAVRDGGDEEPPDVFQKLGLAPSVLPVRWIEAGPDKDTTREYFEDIIGSSSSIDGGERDIVERGHLVITQSSTAPSSMHYNYTVFRIQTVRDGDSKLLATVNSNGTATTDFVVGKQDTLTIYRLDGGATPDQARVFVRFGERLQPPSRKIEETQPRLADTLSLIATATAGRVEIAAGGQDLLNQKVRLHVGQELFVRFELGSTGRAPTLRPGSPGNALKVLSSAETRQGTKRFSVLQFRASSPGWTDLDFSSGAGIRVKVE